PAFILPAQRPLFSTYGKKLPAILKNTTPIQELSVKPEERILFLPTLQPMWMPWPLQLFAALVVIRDKNVLHHPALISQNQFGRHLNSVLPKKSKKLKWVILAIFRTLWAPLLMKTHSKALPIISIMQKNQMMLKF